jgi:hypothetical protein
MSDTLREQQLAFAAHLRDPAHNPAPEGIEDRRMAIYRDLFFNSLEGLLSSNFPVIKQTLGDTEWRALVRAFYATHHCKTPLFTQIGSEFVDSLRSSFLRKQESRPTHPNNRPWLPELAHYEYIELALTIADDPDPEHDPNGDLLTAVPIPSPHAHPHAYTWPVHHIGPDHQPDTPPAEPTLLLVRRDTAGDVHFSTLSPAAYRLLHLIHDNIGSTGRALLLALAHEAAAPDLVGFVRDGADLMERLRADGVLLGTAPRC